MPKLFAPTVVTTVAPTINDDIGDGYVVGQLWLNTVTDTLYVCTANILGAAEWTTVGSGGGVPSAHAGTHVSGSTDPIKLDDLAVPDDNTDLDASTTKHGLLPKLSGSSTQFLNGVGAWTTPAGGGGGGATPIRQLNHSMSATAFSTTSTTFVDTGYSVALLNTLRDTSSKVRIRVTCVASGTTTTTMKMILKRGSTTLTPAGTNEITNVIMNSSYWTQPVCFEFIDSPASTAIQTYSLWISVGTGTGYLGQMSAAGSGVDDTPVTMVIEEITTDVGA